MILSFLPLFMAGGIRTERDESRAMRIAPNRTKGASRHLALRSLKELPACFLGRLAGHSRARP